MQVELLFLKFRSIPIYYFLISWVTNYIRTVSFWLVYYIEKFLAKLCHGSLMISLTNAEISHQNWGVIMSPMIFNSLLYVQWNPDFSNPRFFNLLITRTKSRSLSSVKHCNFTPNFSSSPISQTNLLFPWRFEKSGFHCTWNFWKIDINFYKYLFCLLFKFSCGMQLVRPAWVCTEDTRVGYTVLPFHRTPASWYHLLMTKLWRYM